MTDQPVRAGTVKAVPTGELLIVMGPPRPNGPPPEKELVLTNISVPRLARREGFTDEPYAWAAREFVRKAVIGKVVKFRVEHAPAGSSREYATIWGPDGKNLAQELISAGLASVRNVSRSNPDVEELETLQEEAKKAKLGMWADKQQANAIRNCAWTNFDPQEFLAKHKGKPRRAQVNEVRDGSTLRVQLVPGFELFTMLIAGIQAPSFKRDFSTGEDGRQVVTETPTPYSMEGRYFTSTRLQHREIQVVLHSVDKYNNFHGSIIHPAGDIAEHLLRSGLAKVVPWSAGQIGKSSEYSAAQAAAQGAKSGMWKNYVAPAPAARGAGGDLSPGSSFPAQVIEAINGDSLCVVTATGVEHKVSLASVRAPRFGGRNGPDAPWCRESKEFLRKNLIGKNVTVSVDYERNDTPAGSTTPGPNRVFVTIRRPADNVNIAVAAAKAGMVAVQRHRGIDEERSADYDDLVAAEAEAAAANIGIHARSEPGRDKVNDLTAGGGRDAGRAKAMLDFLTRAGKLSAQVEYVFNGSRFKLRIPSQSVVLMFGLVGVRAPRHDPTARDQQVAGAAESLAFARRNLMQRNVIVSIDAVDRGGTFLGTMEWKDGKQNWALSLVESGLAELMPMADRLDDFNELAAAQTKAQNARRGIWVSYDAAAAAAAAAQAAEAAAPAGSIPTGTPIENIVAEVTEVVDGNNVYYRPSTDDIGKIESALKSFDGGAAPLGFDARTGAAVVAKFSADGLWYRARVTGVSGSEAQVLFIDYGNTERVPKADLRPLPAELNSVPALAVPAQLAFIRARPLDKEYGNEAAQVLSDAVFGEAEPLAVAVEYRANGVSYVTLSRPGTSRSLNAMMVEEGLALVERRREGGAVQERLDALNELNQDARRSRRGMFVHGDIDDEDDE